MQPTVQPRVSNECQVKGKKHMADDSPPKVAKKAKTKATSAKSKAKSSGGALEGLVFAITGTLSIKVLRRTLCPVNDRQRADFVAMLEEAGGEVHGSVTNTVTHLICSDPSTSKAATAKGK